MAFFKYALGDEVGVMLHMATRKAFAKGIITERHRKRSDGRPTQEPHYTVQINMQGNLDPSIASLANVLEFQLLPAAEADMVQATRGIMS